MTVADTIHRTNVEVFERVRDTGDGWVLVRTPHGDEWADESTIREVPE